jgi:hypothetical protein
MTLHGMKRMTAAQYAKIAGVSLRNTTDTSNPPFALPTRNYYALGRMPVGTMNKTEAAYADLLESQRVIGEVLWWKFEGIKLRLADNTFYTCDFAVMPADCILRMDEIKGFWTDDARVKIKVAASLYPFRFRALTPRAKKHGGGYNVEQF